MQKSDASGSDRDNSTVFGVLLGIAVLAFWLLWASSLGQKAVALWAGSKGDDKLVNAGQFGDMFGGVNALFTALAFSAVAWSAFMQRREMKMQRDELEAQREQLELQRQEMEATRRVIAKQAFESTFFQMVEMCRSLHDAIRVEAEGIVGAPAVGRIAQDCQSSCIAVGRDLAKAGHSDQEVRDYIGHHYHGLIYPKTARYLAPYFRSLFHLFKLISSQESLTLSEQRGYANLARAHLSGDILRVLATNACSVLGQDFRPYIEKYGLLKHIDIDTQWAETVQRCFSPSAFLGSEEAPNLNATR